MATVKGQFVLHECRGIDQEIGVEDERMRATVRVSIKNFGTIEPEKVQFSLDGPYKVIIRQMIGARFSKEPIEVKPPQGYRGPFNYVAYREAIQDYYNSYIGKDNAAISIGPGATGVIIEGGVYAIEKRVDFEAEDPGHGW